MLEYDELEFQRAPNPRDHMVNVWGYSHLNFFAPMARFAAGGGGALAAAAEFKQLVKALHAAGIEVILDVVYNHTNEGARIAVPKSTAKLEHNPMTTVSQPHTTLSCARMPLGKRWRPPSLHPLRSMRATASTAQRARNSRPEPFIGTVLCS